MWAKTPTMTCSCRWCCIPLIGQDSIAKLLGRRYRERWDNGAFEGTRNSYWLYCTSPFFVSLHLLLFVNGYSVSLTGLTRVVPSYGLIICRSQKYGVRSNDCNARRVDSSSPCTISSQPYFGQLWGPASYAPLCQYKTYLLIFHHGQHWGRLRFCSWHGALSKPAANLSVKNTCEPHNFAR